MNSDNISLRMKYYGTRVGSERMCIKGINGLFGELSNIKVHFYVSGRKIDSFN